MNPYETSSTVGGQGEIHLVGVPFQPGTEVTIVIRPNIEADNSTADFRLASLLAALDHAHNVEPIGSLRRNELYDRDYVR